MSAEPSIPPIKAVRTTWRSAGKLVRKEAGFRVLFDQTSQHNVTASAEPSTPPVNTVPFGGFVRKRRGKSSVLNPLLHQSTQYHLVAL